MLSPLNPYGIKALLANVLNTIFINGEPVFSNSPIGLARNHSNCIILDSWVFDNFILNNKLFAKVLQRFGIFQLVSRYLCELLIKVDNNHRVTPVLSFAADFNLLT